MILHILGCPGNNNNSIQNQTKLKITKKKTQSYDKIENIQISFIKNIK